LVLNKILILPVFAVLVFVLSFSIHDASATTLTWTGAGDGKNWSDPNNWDTRTSPTSDDTITIKSSIVHLNTNFTLTGSIAIQSSGLS
jgi:hypothetical protein